MLWNHFTLLCPGGHRAQFPEAGHRVTGWHWKLLEPTPPDVSSKVKATPVGAGEVQRLKLLPVHVCVCLRTRVHVGFPERSMGTTPRTPGAV